MTGINIFKAVIGDASLLAAQTSHESLNSHGLTHSMHPSSCLRLKSRIQRRLQKKYCLRRRQGQPSRPAGMDKGDKQHTAGAVVFEKVELLLSLLGRILRKSGQSVDLTRSLDLDPATQHPTPEAAGGPVEGGPRPRGPKLCI